MAFRARRGFETFEKRAPGTRLEKERDGHLRRRPCCCFLPSIRNFGLNGVDRVILPSKEDYK